MRVVEIMITRRGRERELALIRLNLQRECFSCPRGHGEEKHSAAIKKTELVASLPWQRTVQNNIMNG